jgi:uncharacterized protein (DUF39 family)
MGILKPNMKNVSYSGAGELSPLLNDPFLRTIGLGTRILLGGREGFVVWEGTQHDPTVKRNERGIPMTGGGTLAVAANLRGMNARYVRGVSLLGYGASLALGIAIPIPVLDEDVAFRTGVSDADIQAPVVDYATSYPDRKPGILGHVTYAALKAGSVTVGGRTIPASPISSLLLAREVAELLRAKIKEKAFMLTEPVRALPGPDDARPFESLEIREP